MTPVQPHRWNLGFTPEPGRGPFTTLTADQVESYDRAGYRDQAVYTSPGAVPIGAHAGSVVVFSSLTPHRTGPNRTADVRSAYIVQYAPDGAVTLRGDPAEIAAGEARREPQDDPDRQYLVVKDGEPVVP
ncbi:MAG: phytanoyl-CoA dioxygenase family protein [Actinobacteria bacterium]|nr:phytanoyl-CoA dioxygenase family protein [Actinomycetota bacterium]